MVASTRNQLRVEVLPRHRYRRGPGRFRRPDGNSASGYSPLRIEPSIWCGSMTKATARWTGNKVLFDIESGSGHTAQVDEAPVLGDNAAMRPTEMLLGALGGCTGLNAVLLLKKFKQPLRALEVEVEGEREEAWPKACNRYCPIHATLSHGVKIDHKRKDHR